MTHLTVICCHPLVDLILQHFTPDFLDVNFFFLIYLVTAQMSYYFNSLIKCINLIQKIDF